MRRWRWLAAVLAGTGIVVAVWALGGSKLGAPGLPPLEAEPVDLPLPYPALLAAFRTPLQGGETGRLENIRQAAEYMDGAVIGPGGVFSFNDVVGPREEARGFVAAPEIYNGEYVLGIGGGVCQVSSTLYNAALLAGLNIVERMHHSRPLSYVPLGRDATVAYGLLDFSFQNSLPFTIQVRAFMRERELEVQLWGEERSPVDVQIETLAEEVIMPDLHIVADPNLPTGVEWLADEGLPGWRIEVHRVLTRGEAIERQVVSYDEYPARPQMVRIGG